MKHIKSSIVGYLALFVVLLGTAYAHGPVTSEDIVNNTVRSVDVRDNDLRGIDVNNNSLTGADVTGLTGLDVNNNSLTGADVTDNSIGRDDVTNNSLTGLDVTDNSLGSADVTNNSLGGADVTNNSLTGFDVTDNSIGGADVTNDSLTGADIRENTLSVSRMGCQSGKVLGFARIKGNGPIPTTYTSNPAAIDITNNCAGGPVQVRRASTGVYFVKFVGNPAALALAVPNQDGASTAFSGDADNIVTVGKITSGSDAGAFRVDVTDLPGPGGTAGGRQNGQFTMTLP